MFKQHFLYEFSLRLYLCKYMILFVFYYIMYISKFFYSKIYLRHLGLYIPNNFTYVYRLFIYVVFIKTYRFSQSLTNESGVF